MGKVFPGRVFDEFSDNFLVVVFLGEIFSGKIFMFSLKDKLGTL